ncbi:MAG: hypothetical protein F4Y40_04670 [Acidimicrobiia bacterium]|nr:hypothetical protein [Acidimicrobiia bacterium]
MTSVPATDTADKVLTLADIDAATGKNPDPTGDFAAGRTHFHESTDDFLACLASQPSEATSR